MSKRRKPEELIVDEHPIWSPTRLDTAEQCKKFYWLKYIKQIKYPINPSIARGKLFHHMIEHFWKRDEKTRIVIPKYSHSGFIGATIGTWKRFYAQGKEIGGGKMDEIIWDYPGQQWDKNYLGEIAEMAGRVYSRYMDEEPCLIAEPELHANFKGFKIMAKIDELRKFLVIRDHKSGYKKPRQMYLDKNIQMTDYSLCLFIALQDINSPIVKEIYPDYFSIGLDEFLDISKIEIHHLPGTIKTPYRDKILGTWNFRDKEAKTEIYEAKRTRQSINDFVLKLEANERALEERDFHPTEGRQCDFCLAKSVCNNYNPIQEHQNELERNLPLFAFSNLTFGNMHSKKQEIAKQKTMRFKYIPTLRQGE